MTRGTRYARWLAALAALTATLHTTAARGEPSALPTPLHDFLAAPPTVPTHRLQSAQPLALPEPEPRPADAEPPPHQALVPEGQTLVLLLLGGALLAPRRRGRELRAMFF